MQQLQLVKAVLLFNPVLKNGVTVLDTNRMTTYHGDLRFVDGALSLYGVAALKCGSTQMMPVHTHIDDERPVSIKQIFDEGTAQIAVSIGFPSYREPVNVCWCDFKHMTVLFISRKFLDEIKEFNTEWWDLYGSKIPPKIIL